MHRLIIEEKERGAAVLLISEDLDEVLKLSDRIGVLYEGRLAGPVNREDTDIEELGLMMMALLGRWLLVALGAVKPGRITIERFSPPSCRYLSL